MDLSRGLGDVYKRQILSLEAKFRISIEAGTTLGWQKFTGMNGLNIGIDTFGASGPGNILADHFGFTTEKVATRIQEFISNR
jgi:transketolase